MPAGLPTQTITLPIDGGLNQARDARALEPPGAWLTVNNWVYEQSGALRKRHGYDSLPTDTIASQDGANAALAGTLLEPTGLVTLGSQLLVYSKDEVTGIPRISSWSPGQLAWSDKDNVCPASARRTVLQRGPVGSRNGHASVVDGRTVITYAVVAGTTMFKVFDQETGAVIHDESYAGLLGFASIGFNSVSFACGGVVILVAINAGDGALYTSQLDLSTMVWSAPTLVANDVYQFDACVIDSTAGTFAIAYAVDTDHTTLVVETWDVATMASTGSDTDVATEIVLIGVSSNGTNIAAVIFDDNPLPSKDVLCAAWSAALVPLFAFAPVFTNALVVDRVSVCFDQTGNIVTVWDGADAPSDIRARVHKVDLTGTLIGSSRNLLDARIYSRPFVVGSATYIVVHGYMLMCVDHTDETAQPWLLSGFIAPGEASGAVIDGQLPTPAVVDADGLQMVMPIGVITSPVETSSALNTSSGLDLLSLDFGSVQPRLRQSATVNGCLVTTGAFTGWFDGQSCVEVGFVNPPDILTTVITGGAGSIEGADPFPNNVYTYGVCWEWYDEKGNVHRSGLALDPARVTLANTNASIELGVEYLSTTRRGDDDLPNDSDGFFRSVRLVVYRSLKNASDILYRLTPFGSTPLDPLFNIRAGVAPSLTYTDTLSDAQVLALGYGFIVPQDSGGPLDDSLVPASSAVVVHKNRVWLASVEDDKAVWFSKRVVVGEAPGFNVLQQVRLDDSPDGVTALASLDDKLVVFTASRIYYVIGDGPADTGQNGSFSDPYLVTSSVGCIDARSVVAFDGGVCFQASGGIYLLTRALEVQAIGEAVQLTLADYPEVLSASHDADRAWLVWLCRGTFTTAGEAEVITYDAAIFVVFDYHRRAWFTWTLDNDIAQEGQVFWQGQHVWSNGLTVALENENGYDPGGTWITSTLESPWIKLAGIAGYQRVKHVQVTAQKSSPHYLTVDLFIGLRDTVAQTKTFDVTSGGPTLGLPVEKLDMHVWGEIQKSNAIKIRVSDAEPDVGVSTGATGCSIAGLSLLAGVKKGTDKVPAPNRR